METDVEIEVTSFNQKGWGRGSFLERSIDIPGGVPGDLVQGKIWKRRKKKWQADLLKVIHPSTQRVSARCAHVPVCGGCVWQQVDYSAQLEEKQRRIEQLFAPLLEAANVLLPIIPCDDPWEYRNKMEFSFSQNKAGERFLGLVLAGDGGKVFSLKECHLVSDWFSSVVDQVRRWWEESGLKAYRRDGSGTLRALTLREGKRTQDRLVMLTVSGDPHYPISRLQLEQFVAVVKSCTENEERLSIFLRVQQAQKGHPTQFFEIHLFGPDHLKEKLFLHREFTFKISPTSFFQPNTLQAEKLYAEAFKIITSTKQHLLDLYAGSATLGIVLASLAKKVTSMEWNPYSCFDGEVNKELNGVEHLDIICGDVKEKLKTWNEPVDLVVLDPPRMGLGKETLAQLHHLRPPEILYISCNPATQFQDLQQLIAFGYSLKRLQPLDQFPHTPHVEMIAFLQRC